MARSDYRRELKAPDKRTAKQKEKESKKESPEQPKTKPVIIGTYKIGA